MRISCNGVDLGEFEESQIPSLIKSGTINGEAFYWREGMQEWKPISELFEIVHEDQPPIAPEPASKKKNAPTKAQITFLQKREVDAASLSRVEAQILIDEIKNNEAEQKEQKKQLREAARAEQQRIWNQPTAKQLAYLDYHCVPYKKEITKQEATDLISITIKKYPDSDWNDIKHIVRPDLYEYFEREGSAKREYDFAVSELARLQSEENADQDEIDSAADNVKDAKDALNDEKESLEDELFYWSDSLDDGAFPNTYEDINDFMEVFKKPSKTQLKAIRSAFEKQYKIHFDKVSKEQFFLIYKKLYPDCIKKGKSCKFSVDDIVVSSTYSGIKGGKSAKLPSNKDSKGCFGTIVKTCKIILYIFVGLVLFSVAFSLLFKPH